MFFFCECLNVSGEISEHGAVINGFTTNSTSAVSDVACFEALEFLKSVSLSASSYSPLCKTKSRDQSTYNNKTEEEKIDVTYATTNEFQLKTPTISRKS